MKKTIRFLFGIACILIGGFMILGAIMYKLDSTTPDETWVEVSVLLITGVLPLAVGIYLLYPSKTKQYIKGDGGIK